MKKLSRYLLLYKKQIIIGPIFKFTEAVFELIVPLVMAKIIDIGVKQGDINYIIKMGFVIVLLGFCGLGFSLVCQYMASVASQGVGTALRNDLFKHISSLSQNEYDKLGNSTLLTVVNNDVNSIQVAVAMLIRLVVRAPFLVIGSMTLAFILDVKLSLIFVIITPLVALVLYMVMSRSVGFYRVIQSKLDKISLVTNENLAGARVIRAFNKQNTEKERFKEAAEDMTKCAVSVGKISALLNPMTSVILNIGIVAIIWFGGGQVNIGRLSQGQIIAFVNYMMQIMLALMVVANLVVIFTRASACSARINKVFDTNPSVCDNVEKDIIIDYKKAPISFENVCFSYNKDNSKLLNDVNFQINSNMFVGIIGATGSGKSTIVNLMPRFYDTDSGKVCVFGEDVKKYPLKQLRKIFGITPQKAALISGTVSSNLRMAKSDATEEEMKKALEDAQSWDFIKDKGGLDCEILQGGQNMSGGQKQRLTIARALIRKPDILILDDSFSALDYATDLKIRKALKTYSDMTVIMVTQRASSIKNADMIIVVDDGVINGCGTHSQLINTSPVYREICMSQGVEE